MFSNSSLQLWMIIPNVLRYTCLNISLKLSPNCHFSWNIFFLIVDQAAAVLLQRFNYDQGGNSKWMATLVQTTTFPILLIPCFLIPSFKEPSTSSAPRSLKILALIYFSLRVLIASDNMMYSFFGLFLFLLIIQQDVFCWTLLLPSTYSLICATYAAFNAVFS